MQPKCEPSRALPHVEDPMPCKAARSQILKYSLYILVNLFYNILIVMLYI